MNKPDYSNTYWCSKGKHQALKDQLQKLVPNSGEVENADSNPALELFRVASNCYYDLYNNGLGNRGKEFETAFGFSAFDAGESRTGFSVELTQELIDRTETKMDEIIILAAHEQRIGETKGEFIDLTPESLKTPEGAERVRKAQAEWDGATHELANTLQRIVDEIFDRDLNKIAKAEYYSELQTLIGIRQVKQEAFLRAVVGR